MKKSFFYKKGLIALSLTAAALVAAAGVSFAIYTNQTYQRSVVRNRDSEGIRFSSDKLYQCNGGTQNPQKYHYPMGEKQTTMTFQVCNFDQGKSTLINKNTIDYTITFSDISEGVTLSRNGKTIGNHSQSSLQGAKYSVDTYQITLPANYDGIEITVRVEPDPPSLTQNTYLAAILVPTVYGSVQGFSVKREYPDQGTDISKVAAYNVLVTATGSGTARIQWNPALLTIDPFFLTAIKKIDGTDVNEKDGYVKTPMDSMGGTGSYLITFYNKNFQGTDWEALEITATEVTTEPTEENP